MLSNWCSVAAGLAEDLFHSGYAHVVNIDIAEVGVNKMKQRYAGTPLAALQWLHMDATDMQFGEAAFDVVIEKGTARPDRVSLQQRRLPSQ